MIIAITGTPGTGKTSVSSILREKGYNVIDFKKIAIDNNFILSKDEKRNSLIIDIEKIDKYFKKSLKDKNELYIIEGHLTHLLKCIDKTIILRSHPDKLRENLKKRNWKQEKIYENIEAEALDIILCEAVDLHSKEDIFEIDCTDKSIEDISEIIIEMIGKKFNNLKNYKIGNIDWSEDLFK